MDPAPCSARKPWGTPSGITEEHCSAKFFTWLLLIQTWAALYHRAISQHPCCCLFAVGQNITVTLQGLIETMAAAGFVGVPGSWTLVWIVPYQPPPLHSF